eukprot:TRINITY_DN938_c0_g1_i1.p1 TRINITY_DN938_c0_g1~~TRINITY_DN938_c0_g1_i1.p1  ORF type:complete len:387 (-),score=87.31 TRINITY_DN938_c0_g1_i1:139-1299(-)
MATMKAGRGRGIFPSVMVMVVVMVMVMISCALPLHASSQEDLAYNSTSLFIAGQEGYACYRIPTLLRVNNTYLFTTAEGRKYSCADHGYVDVVAKRSTDGGVTWSSLAVVFSESNSTTNVTIGNAVTVFDAYTNMIVMLVCRNNIDVFQMSSADYGGTWSDPHQFASDLVLTDWSWVATGPPNGIQLTDGRLVMPCDMINSTAGYSFVYYSDDHGQSWNFSSTMNVDGNECQPAQMQNGSVVLNMRQSGAAEGVPYRRIALSDDGGETWGPIMTADTLPTPTCEGSFINVPSVPGVYLYSGPIDTTERVNMTVMMSKDAFHYVPLIPLEKGITGYSALTVVHDGTTAGSGPNVVIGCLYERGDALQVVTNLTFATFTLSPPQVQMV